MSRVGDFLTVYETVRHVVLLSSLNKFLDHPLFKLFLLDVALLRCRAAQVGSFSFGTKAVIRQGNRTIPLSGCHQFFRSKDRFGRADKWTLFGSLLYAWGSRMLHKSYLYRHPSGISAKQNPQIVRHSWSTIKQILDGRSHCVSLGVQNAITIVPREITR